MKKFITLLVLIASITTGFAQWRQSSQQRGGPQQSSNYPDHKNNYSQYGSLVVTSAMQKQIAVYVDNQQYQNNGNNGNGDNNGNTGNNGPGNTVSIRQLSAGNHNIAIYQWKTNFWGKQVREEIYNSSINFKPGYETTIFINGLGQVNISEKQVYNNDQQTYGNNGNGVGNGYGRMKNKHKNKHHDKEHDDDDDRRYDRKKDKKDKKEKKDYKDRDDD